MAWPRGSLDPVAERAAVVAVSRARVRHLLVVDVLLGLSLLALVVTFVTFGGAQGSLVSDAASVVFSSQSSSSSEAVTDPAAPVVVDFMCEDPTAAPVLGGLDLVASRATGRPVPGDGAIASPLGDYTFLFATHDARETFLADPDAYAPRYGGLCAWSVSSEWWHTSATWPVGDASVFEVFDDRVYFFQTEAARDLFAGRTTETQQAGHAVAPLSLGERIATGDARWAQWQRDQTLFATQCMACLCDCTNCNNER